MNKVARSDLSAQELSDEVESLLQDYREHMRLHHMKLNHGVLRTLITMTAEAAENLVRLRFHGAAAALFKVSERRILLLEAERAAPGRQLAYLVDIHQRFGS